jgi:hypothetical protein
MKRTTLIQSLAGSFPIRRGLVNLLGAGALILGAASAQAEVNTTGLAVTDDTVTVGISSFAHWHHGH